MKQNRRFWFNQFWFYWALGLILLCICSPPLMDFMEKLEHQSFDTRQATIQESRTQSHISIVKIDDTTIAHPELQRIFGRFPYRRDIYGYFFRFMNRARPKAVTMDLSFFLGNDLTSPEGDKFFAENLINTYPVSSGLKTFRKEDLFNNPISDTETARLLKRLQSQWLALKVSSNNSPLALHEFSGIQPPLSTLDKTSMSFYPCADLLYDSNGKARRALLLAVYMNALIMPTMPMSPIVPPNTQEIEWKEGKLFIGKHSIDLHNEGAPLIRWYGNINARAKSARDKAISVYPTTPFWHIIKSQLLFECHTNPRLDFCSQIDAKNFTVLSPEQFKDQYVFLGVTTNTFDQDNHPSLYDEINGFKYPGVYIQANILDNLLHDDFVSRPGWRIPCTLIPGNTTVSLVTLLTVLALMSTTLYCCLRWTSIPLSVIAVAALAAGYGLFTVYAYQEWNLWLNMVYPLAGMLVCLTGGYIYRYHTTEKRKEEIRSAFGRYISPAVVDTIMKKPDHLKTTCHRRRMTILFCDIRGFTTLSESQDPETVQKVLTQYFSMMNRIIMNDYHGVIDKLIGDAIMAYWGFPLENVNHAEQAVACALAMQKALEQWHADPEKPPIDIGIGIHTGEVMVGDVGSEDFMDFTVIGDAVNIASRLEGGNKQFSTRILISEATYQSLPEGKFPVRDLGTIELKGKSEPIHVFEPLVE